VLAFGLALADLGVSVAQAAAVAPPPHRTLLALLARLSGGAPHTYWDIQIGPYAAPARAALAAGAARLADTVEDGRRDDFAAVLTDMGDLLGADLKQYRDLCTQTFAVLAKSPHHLEQTTHHRAITLGAAS
jgi:4-amino-4-deoxyprephenate dehydrogenase